MKKIIIKFILISISLLSISTIIKNSSRQDRIYNFIDTVAVCDEKIELNIINKDQFLKMNAHIESRGRWNVANRYGYIGRYQLGKKALIDLGYDSSWVSELRNSIYNTQDTIIKKNGDIKIRNFYYFDLDLFPPHKQKEAIKKYINKNEHVYLKDHIDEYVGKKIGGILITKAGILSASFIGIGYVDSFLKSNGKINPKDGNGHSIKDRMAKFQKYELE